MSPFGAIVFAIVSVLFAFYMFKTGMAMVKIPSVLQALDRYEKNPASGSFIEKYFYGWAFPGQKGITRATIGAMGDKMVTGMFKLAGAFFSLMSLLIVVSSVMIVVTTFMAG